MESLGFIAKSLAKLITLFSSVPSNRSVTLCPSFFISLSLSLSALAFDDRSSPCSSSISPACLSFPIVHDNYPSSMGLLFTNKAAGLLHGFVAARFCNASTRGLDGSGKSFAMFDSPVASVQLCYFELVELAKRNVTPFFLLGGRRMRTVLTRECFAQCLIGGN